MWRDSPHPGSTKASPETKGSWTSSHHNDNNKKGRVLEMDKNRIGKVAETGSHDYMEGIGDHYIYWALYRSWGIFGRDGWRLLGIPMAEGVCLEGLAHWYYEISQSFQPIVWSHLRRFCCSYYLSLVVEQHFLWGHQVSWLCWGLILFPCLPFVDLNHKSPFLSKSHTRSLSPFCLPESSTCFYKLRSLSKRI